MKATLSSRKERLFKIITIGSREDIPSRLFDYALVVTIISNIAATFMLTFESLSSIFSVLHVVEVVTLILFCIEYILRIWTSEYLYPKMSKGRAVLKFLTSFDGVVDFLTILPLVSLYGFIAFRMLRVVRIFHLFRINNTYDSFNVIAFVIQEKKKQIASSVLIIMIFMLASSLGIYSVEHEAQPEAFSNAFSGIWWSVSALLTVGYGDIYPITVLGKIMGILVAFLGVGLVAIPTGIISAGFVEQYSIRAQANKSVKDVESIGEIHITKESEYCGRTIREINSNKLVHVILVIRDELKIIPANDVVIKENDILVVESEKIVKK